MTRPFPPVMWIRSSKVQITLSNERSSFTGALEPQLNQERWSLITMHLPECSQSPPRLRFPTDLRGILSTCLHIPESKVHVIVKYVGGSFGNYKYHAEDVLVSYCAMILGRPVKWTADRREIFSGNYHAREQDPQGDFSCK